MWLLVRRGTKRTEAFDTFAYRIEQELFILADELAQGTYRHGAYQTHVVSQRKRRQICIASYPDRIVQRLLYEYLVRCFDHVFLYDVWSSRRGKGLRGAIDRVAEQVQATPRAYVWRADIRKCFDHIDHEILLSLLPRRVHDARALWLCEEIIRSYAAAPGKGIPIGNVTSQIFSNIYLHEFDRYVAHTLRPLRYVRYGDDMVLLYHARRDAAAARDAATKYLSETLRLSVHPTCDILIPVERGIRYCGTDIFPSGVRLAARTARRASDRLTHTNSASYYGIIHTHQNTRRQQLFDWHMVERLLY